MKEEYRVFRDAPKNKQAYRKGLPLVQLYDMKAGISEKVNVEANHPEVVKHLTKLMKTYLKTGRSTSGRPLKNDVPVDIWKKDYKLPDSQGKAKIDPTVQ